MNRNRCFRRWQAFALALSLVLGALFGATAIAATTRYTGTTTADVNIRSSPSSKATKIGTIKKGVKVTLIGSSRKGEKVNGYTVDMHFFKLSTGGYIAQAYVTNVKAESAAASSGTTTTKSAATSGESTSNQEEVLDLDDDGNPIATDADPNVTPDDPDAIPLEEPEVIDDTDDTGLTVVETTPAPPQTSSGSANTAGSSSIGVRMIVTTSNLNVRNAPSTTAPSVRKLADGAVIRATVQLKSGAIYNGKAVTGTWYMLTDGNFVSGDFLKRAGTSTVTSSTASQPSSKSVTTATAKSSATYYGSPSALAFERGTMRAGDTKDVSATYKDGSTLNGNRVSGNWYKLSNGYYVRSSDVSIGSRKVATTTTVKVTKTTLKTGDLVAAKTNVNVRSGPGTGFAKVASMTAGARDTVTSVAQNGSKYDGKTVVNGWVKLKSKGGFVQADYLVYAEGKLTVIESGASYGKAPSAPTTEVATTPAPETTIEAESDVLIDDIPEE